MNSYVEGTFMRGVHSHGEGTFMYVTCSHMEVNSCVAGAHK